jgi:FkbM family methyltransferase
MALRSMLRRGAHRVWGRLNHGAVVTRGPGGWKLRVAPDGYEDLRYWLRYEAATAELLRRELKTGWQILDIGAHHGVFGVCCAPSLPSRLVAVEPSPQALPLLEANARAQPGARWEVVRAAVGAAPGRMQLYPGLIHMLVSDPRLHPGAAARPLEVEVTTVDTLCRARGLRPDLIKLDVEAYEAEALAGAAETLAQGPRLILEWHCAMLRQRGLDPLAALAPLAAAGYRCHPFEFPELGVLPAGKLHLLPTRDIYRLYCEPGA